MPCLGRSKGIAYVYYLMSTAFHSPDDNPYSVRATPSPTWPIGTSDENPTTPASSANLPLALSLPRWAFLRAEAAYLCPPHRSSPDKFLSPHPGSEGGIFLVVPYLFFFPLVDALTFTSPHHRWPLVYILTGVVSLPGTLFLLEYPDESINLVQFIPRILFAFLSFSRFYPRPRGIASQHRVLPFIILGFSIDAAFSSGSDCQYLPFFFFMAGVVLNFTLTYSFLVT